MSKSAGIGNGRVFQIEDVYPAVDFGRYPVKRIAGEPIAVWADIFRHGHDVIAAELSWRPIRSNEWRRKAMRLDVNDRWWTIFSPQDIGQHEYMISAWTDEFATWRRSFSLKARAGQANDTDALEGAALVSKAEPVDGSEAAHVLRDSLNAFLDSFDTEILMSERLAEAMAESQSRQDITHSDVFPLTIDRPAARASAWYEMVPRSQGQEPGRHGTFADCIERLPDIAGMGFDVVYLTPIHPIGETNRKGRNNALKAEPGDPGSPYAIGSAAGGHDAVHPELGTLDDFRAFVAACQQHGMEVALDFAVQCSPDHPWIREHPTWFRRRPDGTIRYAENPPKKYEDIVNPDFEGPDASALCEALRDVLMFWIAQGVRIFRVDNPHTKPLPFWEWLIATIQREHPDTLFLSEAFTRPKLMKALAKRGFTQSYTYFTWRTERAEIETYLRELTGYPEREYYRPNFFVSTPDILPFHLQSGAPWMFKSRFALAATLSGAYGIYNGFELLEHTPVPGKEEYLDSEKYEIKVRDWNQPGNIKSYIARLNRIRRENPALLQTANLTFLGIGDPNVIGFVKEAANQENTVAAAIALSPEARQVWLPLGDAFVGSGERRRHVAAVENLLTGERHGLSWGGVNIHIDPSQDPMVLLRCLG